MRTTRIVEVERQGAGHRGWAAGLPRLRAYRINRSAVGPQVRKPSTSSPKLGSLGAGRR